MGKRTYDVFVSYRSTDKKVVAELARRLETAGLKVWLDAWTILGGDDFAKRIEEGLEASRSVALMVGPGSFGPWHEREMSRAVKDRRKRLIPVLLPKARLDKGTPLELERLSRIDLTKGLSKDGILALVAAIKSKPITRAKAEEKADPPKRKKPRPKVGSGVNVIGNGNQVATNGGIVAGNITGSVLVTGGGNVVRVRRSDGQ